MEAGGDAPGSIAVSPAGAIARTEERNDDRRNGNPADGPNQIPGAIGPMIAAMAMAMYAMAASVSYQHRGFFTPLFHISALFGSPKPMMTSKQCGGRAPRWSTGPTR